MHFTGGFSTARHTYFLLFGIALGAAATVGAQTADLSIAVTDTPDPVVAGAGLSYALTVANSGPDDAVNAVVDTTLPPGVTFASTIGCAEDPSGVPTCSLGTVTATPVFRAQEYAVIPGAFTGLTYDLGLSTALEPNYFVIVQGSAVYGATDTTPGDDSVRLSGDPFGTGDLAVTPAATLRLSRGQQSADWVGIVTVVECLTACASDGFELLAAEQIDHAAGNASGNDSSTTAWTDFGRVLLMGGANGAGCENSELDAGDHAVCHTRLYPSGANTINWTRDSTSSNLGAASTTVMVVQWGSSWTVQRTRVTGSNGGNGVDATGEYNTAAIASIARNSTWVWATGHTDGSGVGDCAEGVVYTLGDGVNQQPNETMVAVATEQSGTAVDFEVWAMSYPGLAVDYRKKADGDSAAFFVDVPVDSAGVDTRFALSANGAANTNNSFPRPIFSARYLTDTTVRLERQRADLNFPAWVQGIDLGAIGPLGSMAIADIELQVTVDPDTAGTIIFSPSVSSDTTDPNTANNTATATTAVTSEADLAIAVGADPNPVIAGREVLFAVVVDNLGPSLASGVAVNVATSAWLTPQSTVGCLEDPGGIPTCTLGPIGAAGQGGYQLLATTDFGAHGNARADFFVSSAVPDPVPANDGDTATVRLTGEIEAGQGDQPALGANQTADHFLVAWRSDTVTKGRADAGIVVRLFDIQGDALTDTVRVSGPDGSSQGQADVAYLSTGDLAVVWQSEDLDGDDFGIFCRLVDAAGMPVGVEFQLNSATAGAQTEAAIDADEGGRFVVAWADETGVAQYTHSGRIFDSAGMPVGVEFSFGSATEHATPPDVGVRTAGDFAAVWTDSGGNVMRRMFSPNGMPVGVELQVSTAPSGGTERPVIDAAGDGSFVVVWEQDSGGASGVDINARRLNASGMPVGVELQVNTSTASDQSHPSVSISSSGEFVVAWESDDGDGRGVFARLINISGMPVGVEFQINRTDRGNQGAPDVAYVSDDTYYVVWETDDTDGDLIDEVLIGEPEQIFFDGFDSGDTVNWDRAP